MKRCPFCAEEIQDAAIKCKHCGEFLEGYRVVRAAEPAVRMAAAEPDVPWYYRTAFVVLMLASVGPFALPLVWFRPKLSLIAKVLISVGVIVLTWLLTKAFLASLAQLRDMYKMLGGF